MSEFYPDPEYDFFVKETKPETNAGVSKLTRKFVSTIQRTYVTKFFQIHAKEYRKCSL